MQFDTRSLWIYLHFPQLQLDLITHNQASQANHPIAIVDVANNQLCQVNESARKESIKVGMGLASASLLCSNLHLQEYKQELENNHIANIANHLYMLTSDIVLAPPNALILRAQNMLSLYQGLAGYWRVIQQSLQDQKVHFVAASAYSIQAAKMIALGFCKQHLETQSSGKRRPHKNMSYTQHAITNKREEIATTLASCLLNVSDIDPKDLHKLARIGIKSYADLQQLPLAEVANRVSRFSMSIINELNGKQAAKVTFYQPKATYHDYIELLYEISLSDKLLPVIGRCLDKLSQFLLIRNAHSLSIEIGFFQREHNTMRLAFNSIRPIYKSQDWLDIIRLKLESICFESPVFGLSLQCLEYEVAHVANNDMVTQKSTHVAALTLLSRLQSKLGEQSVHSLQYIDDFRPEMCAQLNSVLQLKKHTKDAQQTNIFADRPGLLLPQPETLTLEVQIVKGPERIQTGWWDDQAINRDYYIGQSQNGQQVWIFKTPDQQWYLHGYFV